MTVRSCVSLSEFEIRLQILETSQMLIDPAIEIIRYNMKSKTKAFLCANKKTISIVQAKMGGYSDQYWKNGNPGNAAFS